MIRARSAPNLSTLQGSRHASGLRAAEGFLFLTMLVLISLGVTALGFVGYAL